MSSRPDPWSLPSAAAFLDEIEAAHDLGFAAIGADPAMPEGCDRALRARLDARSQEVCAAVAEAGRQPVDILADILRSPAHVGAMCDAAFCSTTVIVDLSDLDTASRYEWSTFAARFRDTRDQAGRGVSLVLAGVPVRESLPEKLGCLRWADRMRRVDIAIWADLHSPAERPEPVGSLAAALAVELCGWRIDLAGAVVRARRDDLVDPVGWLERRGADPLHGARQFGGKAMHCPMALLLAGDRKELERRVWRAQLVALFPWIEEARQATITRHRRLLIVDEHLLALGVRDVEEIELAALAWQLRNRIPRAEAQKLDCFGRIRNALAHRKAALPVDLLFALPAGLVRLPS